MVIVHPNESQVGEIASMTQPLLTCRSYFSCEEQPCVALLKVTTLMKH